MRGGVFKRHSNLTLKQARDFYLLNNDAQKQQVDKFLLDNYHQSDIARFGKFLRMTSKTTVRNDFGTFNNKRDVIADKENLHQEIQQMHEKIFEDWKNENETLWLSDRVVNNEVNFEFDAYIAVDEENAMPFVVAKQSMLGQFLVRAIDGVNSQDEFHHDEIVNFLIRKGLLVAKNSQSMAELTAKIKEKQVPQSTKASKEKIEYLGNLNRVVTILRKVQYINRQHTLIGTWVKHFTDQYGERHKVDLKEAYQNYNEFRKKNNLIKTITPIDWIPINQMFNDIVELTDQDLQKIEQKLNVANNDLFKIKLTVGVEERQKGNAELIGLFSVAENAYLTAYTNYFVAQQPKMFYAIDVVASYAPELGMYATNSENKIKMSSLTKNESDLQVSDLSIVVVKGELVIINRNDNQCVIPYNPTAISYDYDVESGLAHFLQSLSNYMLNLPNSNIYLPAIRANSFIPEIRYKNIIIAPKTWQIVTSKIQNKNQAEGLIDQLRMHKVVPNLFSILENGQKFPINLNSPIGQCLLEKSLIKKNFIYIVQDVELESSDALRNNTFVSVTTGTRKIENNFEPMFNYPKIPNLDWKTIVIVVRKQNIDAVLDEMLSYAKTRINRYFFVRYVDTIGWQIRLRIPISSENVSSIARDSMSFSGVSEVLIRQYFPEKSRYGDELISNAESVFVAESVQTKTVQQVLNQFSIDEKILLVAFDLYRWKFNFNNLEMVLHQSKLFQGNIANILEGLQELKQVTQDVNQLTNEYIEKLIEKYNNSYAQEVWRSLLHMRINRWIGINRTIENNMLVIFFKIMRKVHITNEV